MPSLSTRGNSYRMRVVPTTSDDAGASTAATPTPPDAFRLYMPLSKGARRGFWALLLLLQALHATYMTFLATIYVRRNVKTSFLYDLSHSFLFSEANAFLDRYHLWIAVSSGFFAAGFSLLALDMVVWSLWNRRICFMRPDPLGRSSTIVLHHSRSPHPVSPGTPSGILAWGRGLRAAWNSVFGLRGVHFGIGMTLRELVEVAMQTRQAYALSRFVSRLWVNQSFGVVIFANCVSSTAIHAWLTRRRHEAPVFAAWTRFACILADFLLDFCWGIAIPMCLFAPHVVAHSRNEWTGNVIDQSTDLLRKEVEQVLVLSLENYLWGFLPMLSSMANLLKMRRLLHTSDGVDTVQSTTNVVVKSSTSVPATAPAPAPATTETSVKTAAAPHPHPSSHGSVSLHSVHRAMELMLACYGVGLLLVSISASGVLLRDTSSQFSCDHQVYPWFATQKACSRRIINCTAAGIRGARDELQRAVALFYAPSLTLLEITDCDAVDLPQELFRHLFKLNILTLRFSRVATWDVDAAVTPLRELTTLKLSHVELATVPLGLVQRPLPPSLEFVSIYNTDMSHALALPDSLRDNWRSVHYFYCDACNLSVLPVAMYELEDLQDLSLCSNGMTELPDAFAARQTSLLFIYLSGNPLQALPDSLWHKELQDVFRRTDQPLDALARAADTRRLDAAGARERHAAVRRDRAAGRRIARRGGVRVGRDPVLLSKGSVGCRGSFKPWTRQ
ncbi:hypothetical protein PINS_up013551 [Pythium insidiosum]|nr:hypothetical protein PINS_up013551 [Pythium insidiosum]